jgi:CRP/FNR family transcriptional regulator, cyclic AMP receptor protein
MGLSALLTPGPPTHPEPGGISFRLRRGVRSQGSGRVIIDSIGIGDLLGCSWLFPPYRWAFGAACVTAVRAFEFDAAAIRVRCAADPEFGAEFRERLLRVLARRLQGTRTRLIAGSMSDGA